MSCLSSRSLHDYSTKLHNGCQDLPYVTTIIFAIIVTYYRIVM